MKVRMTGRDGGDVVCFINPENYDSEKMVVIDTNILDRSRLNA